MPQDVEISVKVLKICIDIKFFLNFQNFQAVCPDLSNSGIGDEPDRDQLVYKPGNMCAESEDTVVKFARTYRTTVLLENPQINELERTAFQGDRVKIDALDCVGFLKEGTARRDRIIIFKSERKS